MHSHENQSLTSLWANTTTIMVMVDPSAKTMLDRDAMCTVMSAAETGDLDEARAYAAKADAVGEPNLRAVLMSLRGALQRYDDKA